MKKAFQQTISFLMAALLLLSTISWKVEKHYCMGRLMNMALFVDVDDCGMYMALSGYAYSELSNENPCCDDEVLIVEGQDDLKLSLNDIDVDQQSFFTSYINSYIDLFSSLKERPVPHEQYPPPILVKNIHLLDEVFLI